MANSFVPVNAAASLDPRDAAAIVPRMRRSPGERCAAPAIGYERSA